VTTNANDARSLPRRRTAGRLELLVEASHPARLNPFARQTNYAVSGGVDAGIDGDVASSLSKTVRSGRTCARENVGMTEIPLSAKLGAEALGTFWLVFGGCGSAVLAATF
jgi:hypothetical protein